MLRTHTLAGVLITAITSTVAAQNWVELRPLNSPGDLSAQAMAYDVANDTTILFGGARAGVRIAETWLFDGTDWTMATPATTPPARVAHPMVYDLGRSRIVMHGGIPAAGGVIGDTWEWDGTDWMQMTPTTMPSARRSHAMVYHPGRGTAVMHGGYSTVDLNDTWEWNGVDWAQIVTANAPTPRRASAMAYEPVGNGIVLFSGYPNAPQDTWYFDNTDWAQLTTTTLPPGRWDHMMETDPIRSRVVMFGGTGSGDTWEFDGTDWVDMAPETTPPGRLDGYMSYDLVRGQVMNYGGGGRSDTWVYQTPPQAGFAASIPYGMGCPNQYETVYEDFGAGSFDLSDSMIQFLPSGSGYVMLYVPATPAWFTPASAPLAMADETVIGPLALGFTLPFPGGTATDIYISSNGFITSAPPANAQYHTGSSAPMFAGPPRWSPLWSDLDPGAGGDVYFDLDPVTGDAIVTFDNVTEWSGAGSSHTFQVVFQSTGIIEMRFQTCTSVARPVTTGWCPGNGVNVPPSIDISAITTPVTTGPFLGDPLWQRADLRPVVGNVVTLTTGGIPAGSPLGATIFGLQEYNPGFELSSIGMPGCFQYVSMDAVGIGIPTNGMISGTFSVPNLPALAGVMIKSQGAALATGYNALGAISSNGVKMTIDIN